MTCIITGIAGFIGSNLAERLMRDGHSVIGIDNLGRKGANENLARIRSVGDVDFHQGDIREDRFLRDLFAQHRNAETVFHLAGQVAVTTSVTDPRDDFGSNALGTFNVLEAVRTNKMDPVLIYSSTNKVYGKMDDLEIQDSGDRYNYANLPEGVSETRPLDFHSPYGCSKGTGDQYVIDYARIYGLRTVCLRQSCIYGINQFGIEDQGWVAWFTIAALLGKKISVYGDGKQVRDVLFIDDLIDAYLCAVQKAHITAGQVFNIGGGPANTLSIRQLLAYLESHLGKKIDVSMEDWRPGDQKVFIADVRKAHTQFGWEPRTSVEQGITKLCNWASMNIDTLRRLLG
ncbi:MAG: dTDP-D-glucose 4,6-dehydratase [Bryobacterales bacterium]|nr:dTDP-D-glucose 4,6-dehydratase [Bryobacterales bacterium]